jgi:hemolysin activation/secretion protein
MKKLLVFLSISAISASAYLALDATGQLDMFKPVQVQTPVVAEPEEEVVEETKSEDQQALEQAQAAASAALLTPDMPVQLTPAIKRLPKAEVKQAADVHLIVREIRFEGNSAFTQAELKGVVSEFIGQELTIVEAMAIPARVAKHYQNNQMVARATLVGALAREDGVLKIGIIESQIKQAQLDKALTAIAAKQAVPVTSATPIQPPAPTPTPGPVQAPATAALPAQVPMTMSEPPKVSTEQPVSQVAKLEVRDNASVVNKFADMSPSMPLPTPKPSQSEEDAETAFILKQYGNKSRQYELWFDNQGYASTGSSRAGLGFVMNDALSKGDSLSLKGLKSQGSQFLQVAYNWATGIDGLKLGAHLSSFNYNVVNDLQTAVNRSGDGLKKGLILAYDLVNNASEMSTLGLTYDIKSLNTTAATYADSAYYDTRVMGIKFKGFERELAPGGAVFTYDATLSQGTVDMNGSPNQAADLAGENTAGDFAKLRLSLSVLQPLSGVHSFYTGLTLQRADKNLDASEKIYVGGPLGVRAYGVGEGMGTDGEILNFEFRQKLSANTTLSEFYDWGRVSAWHDPSAPGAPANNSSTLQGAGVSLTHRFDAGITLKGTWAHKLGDEPASSAMPRGHSGQYDRNRFWFSMESRF